MFPGSLSKKTFGIRRLLIDITYELIVIYNQCIISYSYKHSVTANNAFLFIFIIYYCVLKVGTSGRITD